jgi:ABC-type phosphate transport system permease subunit/ABC-type phosphate transport system auxiliary subunit
MSTATPALPQPRKRLDAPKPACCHRRRPRVSHPGIALTARGEPLVWLTGGALAVSLLMIVGLLGLIVFQGTVTFWPRPIDKVELRDGRVFMGEVARREKYDLWAASLAGMPKPIAAAAEIVLGGRPKAEVRRELLRTGNVRLTHTHFDWVSEFEIAEGGKTRPPWAVVVEQTEWGRFYGFPQEFVVHHQRLIPQSEQTLQSIIEFFEQNRGRLSAEHLDEIAPALDEMQQELQQLRRANVARFIRRFEPPAGGRLDAVSADGRVVSIAGVTDEDIVSAIEEVWVGSADAWRRFQEFHSEVRQRDAEQKSLRKHEGGAVDRRVEQARLSLCALQLEQQAPLLARARDIRAIRSELAALVDARSAQSQMVHAIGQAYGADSPLTRAANTIAASADEDIARAFADAEQRLTAAKEKLSKMIPRVVEAVDIWITADEEGTRDMQHIEAQISDLSRENARYELRMRTAQDSVTKHPLPLGEIVRAYPANQLSLVEKVGVYLSRWGEFLSEDPREANSEGGVFPAIWGTVAMTIIMSLIGVPFGVLSALYLREYARQGMIVSAVRISINNLAGVPSIVFGVFGLGFFCYGMGAFIDGGPENAGLTPWPEPKWFLALGLLAVIALGAFLGSVHSLAGRHVRKNRLKRIAGIASIVLWLGATAIAVLLIARSPFFDGFFAAGLPNPTFGKGGLLWSSLTLALLTVPVVIVATEEALSAVPNSMREGSYACGASKWQTIKRIVLPRAMPGIMTGAILAMARGAGEVAPLMLVGAVKLAPELPVDGVAPFVHPDRSFMHLGFHIFDLAFQSQNSEASKPMVYTTTLLLIVLIALLNVAAMRLRARWGRRFRTAQF